MILILMKNKYRSRNLSWKSIKIIWPNHLSLMLKTKIALELKEISLSKIY